MRKLKLLLLAFCALFAVSTNAVAGTKTVYLKPGSWNTANAWYALYAFKDDGNTWSVFTELNGTGIYKATFDDSYTGYNLVRLRPSTAEGYNGDNDGMNWSNKWGQTGDSNSSLSATDIVYTMTNAENTNSAYTTENLSDLSDATSLSDGKYLFKNVATGKYMGPGNSWGTRASLIEPTYFNTIDGTDLPDGFYKIETQVNNGGTSNYLGLSGGALYMDNGGATLRIKEVSTGKYAVSVNDGLTFIGYDGSNTTLVWSLTNPSENTNAQWQIIPYNDAVDDLSNATLASPKDASFLVKCANFDRNDRNYNSSWTVAFDRSAGWDSYHHTGRGEGSAENQLIGTWAANGRRIQVSQSLTSLPNGIYKITCQGFYRDGAAGNESILRKAYLYANNQSSPLMNLNDGAKNGSTGAYQQQIGSTGKYVVEGESNASTAFSDGDYSDNEVYAYVSDGSLEIGIRKEEGTDDNWMCFDNFRLYYCGTLASAAATATAANPVNMTYLINNPKASFDLSGWTISTTIRNASRGFDAAPGFFEIADWNANSWNSSITQSLSSLPTGIYKIQAAGQQSTEGTTLEMVINSGTPTSFDHNGDTNGTINISGEEVAEGSGYQGWRYKTSPEVYINNGNLEIKFQSTASEKYKWANIDNIELYYLGNPYPALNSAITAADASSHTLGFDNGEYAPYANIEMLGALEEGSTIYSAKTATAAQVEAATAAITGATWTPNVGSVECVYNGDFSQGSWGIGGWSRPESWGKNLPSDVEGLTTDILKAAGSTTGSAYYNQTGSLVYGNTENYKMPLKANTIYTLTFKYASWETNSNNSVTASVLNSSDGMAAITYGQNATIYTAENSFVTKTVKFVTGEAGNYILTLANNGNTVITDVSITKDANQYLEFADGSVPSYAPGTYPSVKISRSLTANRWATAVYPFAVSGVSEIAVLDSYESSADVLHFRSAAQSVANEPFFMRSTEMGGMTEINLTDVAVEAATANPTLIKNEVAKLIGAYTSTNITSEEGKARYVLSNNTIYEVGEDAAIINPYRAYIQIDGASSGHALTFSVDGEETSEIEGLNVSERQLRGDVYNLNGQLVRKNAASTQGLQKGVYIVGGQRIIVK